MKKTVKYIPGTVLNAEVIVGQPCILFPINHDNGLVSNKKFARTTPVVDYDINTGVVETENTIYVPD